MRLAMLAPLFSIEVGEPFNTLNIKVQNIEVLAPFCYYECKSPGCQVITWSNGCWSCLDTSMLSSLTRMFEQPCSSGRDKVSKQGLNWSRKLPVLWLLGVLLSLSNSKLHFNCCGFVSLILWTEYLKWNGQASTFDMLPLLLVIVNASQSLLLPVWFQMIEIISWWIFMRRVFWLPLRAHLLVTYQCALKENCYCGG